MGQFTQKPQEPSTWAALPGEPLDDEADDRLDDAPVIDPMDVGLGGAYTTVAFPVAPPAPQGQESAEDGGDQPDAGA